MRERCRFRVTSDVLSTFRALPLCPQFQTYCCLAGRAPGLKARDRRNDGAAFRSPALGHQRRGIAGVSTPRIAGASAKIRIFAGHVAIAARRSRRELRPDADPGAAASIIGRARTPRLSAAAEAAAPAAWRSSPPSAAPRRASADLVAERCDAAICPESGEKRKCAACA